MSYAKKLESAKIKIRVFRTKARILEKSTQKLWDKANEIQDSLRLLKLKVKLEIDGTPVNDYRPTSWSIPAKQRLNGTYWLGFNNYNAKYNNKIMQFRVADSSWVFVVKAAKAFAKDGTVLKFVRPKEKPNTAFAELKNLLNKQGYTLTKK